VRPPLCSPNTIGRPSEERFSACSPVPTEQSYRYPNRQARPERLAGESLEPKREMGRYQGEAVGDSWGAATHLTRAVHFLTIPR